MFPVGFPPALGSSPVKFTPGAARSGSSRSPLSLAGSAPLENVAIVSPDQLLEFLSSNAPTLTTFQAVAGDPTQAVLPSFPAATYCESAAPRTRSSSVRARVAATVTPGQGAADPVKNP